MDTLFSTVTHSNVAKPCAVCQIPTTRIDLHSDIRLCSSTCEQTWMQDCAKWRNVPQIQVPVSLIEDVSEHIYTLQARELVHHPRWEKLCECAQVCSLYGLAEIIRDEAGFENETFAIRPYDWSDCEEDPRPNFEHKPSGFKLWWYKYAFRGVEMNQPLSVEGICTLFEDARQSI